MATKRDYYEVLGVPRDATQSAIKSAYRKLAIQFHPDRNQDDPAAEANFKEAAEAYSALSDPNKRAQYDRFGHRMEGGFGGFDPSVFGDFSDILGDLFGFGGFGGRRRGVRGIPGADLRYDLSLSFEEAAFGKEVEILIPRLETCETCSGSGSRGGNLRTCATCGGQGQVRISQGFFAVAQTCPNCRGEGQVVTDPCPDCRGDGRQEADRNLKVTIPAGVDNGIRMRLRGEGEHGRRGGPPGDLDVLIRVEPHPRFERDGFDVHEELPLSYPQLVLGTTIEIETLHDRQKLQVPPGTTPSHQFRLRGLGIPRLSSHGRGDHVVHTALKVPRLKELDDERIELLHQLAELDGSEVHEHHGVIDKVKSFFS